MADKLVEIGEGSIIMYYLFVYSSKDRPKIEHLPIIDNHSIKK